jgi:hypothetical protein
MLQFNSRQELPPPPPSDSFWDDFCRDQANRNDHCTGWASQMRPVNSGSRLPSGRSSQAVLNIETDRSFRQLIPSATDCQGSETPLWANVPDWMFFPPKLAS